MQRAILVYTTFSTVVEAERVGEALVEARLAACVNILPGMISHYRWEGEIARAEEAVMLVKTRAELGEDVRAAIRALHSYATPMIAVIPLASMDGDTLAWLMAATERGEPAT
ncbi:MAG: divalent-cation tolerance protein CutA [Xanthobacteraceae bacterium]|nr:MAG: divalent-cation tolerance protein CutA [Xanthobacteraceae bacterium]